jgi:hypothetical protein
MQDGADGVNMQVCVGLSLEFCVQPQTRRLRRYLH